MVLVSFMAQPRLLFAMAKDGLLPHLFAEVGLVYMYVGCALCVYTYCSTRYVFGWCYGTGVTSKSINCSCSKSVGRVTTHLIYVHHVLVFSFIPAAQSHSAE